MGRLPLLLITLVLAAVLMPSAILMGILMVPSLFAYMIDRNPRRYLTMTVGLPNFCGVLPALVALWERGQSFDGAFNGIADPWNMMVAYGAGGSGWLLYFGTPIVVSSYLSIATDGKVKSIRKYQESLIEAWGEGVKKPVTAQSSGATDSDEQKVL